MIEKNTFATQMGRLAIIFEPDRFVGTSGKVRLQEMYPFFMKGNPDDLRQAVSAVIETFDRTYKSFPSVAHIKKHFQTAARNRQDRTPKLAEPVTRLSRKQVSEIIRRAGFKSTMADV